MRATRRGTGGMWRGVAAAAMAVLWADSAQAIDLLGGYVGASVGQARVETGSLEVTIPGGTASAGSFSENHSAFKLLVGVRPLSVIGAELEYLDFGHPSRGFSSAPASASADVKMDGAAAFGVVYLLPVPVLDVFVKAGVARLQASGNATIVLPGVGTCTINSPNCATISQHYSATNTSAAGGVGVQVKVGPYAVRAEYERFNAAGGNPGLASIGASWFF